MLLYWTFGSTSTAAEVICRRVRSRSLGLSPSAIRRAASRRRLSSMRRRYSSSWRGRNGDPSRAPARGPHMAGPADGYDPTVGVLTFVTRGAAAAGGQALRAATVTLAAARPADKPLHPDGSVVGGVLQRFGSVHTGAAWLDEAGED